MDAALRLARRGLGTAWPNPAVGCVIVRHGVVVGRGWTQPGGRPHAETEALKQAGAAARGASAFVTLEPCAHHGQTPSCAAALVAAGVDRVVAAVVDPDPRVSGRGFEILRRAGITVVVGVGAVAARRLNAGFFLRLGARRPLVTLKVAASLDGRIATRTGASQWITGAVARRRGHLLRATHDAILLGIGTALADDPRLTCRLPGYRRRHPLVRIVLDSRLRLSPESVLVRTAAQEGPLWLLHGPDADMGRRAALAACPSVRLFPIADGDSGGGLSIIAALRALADQGLTRVLAEGGGRVAAALLRAGCVDDLIWFGAGVIVGGDGVPAVAPYGVAVLADAARFACVGVTRLGADWELRFRSEALESGALGAPNPA